MYFNIFLKQKNNNKPTFNQFLLIAIVEVNPHTNPEIPHFDEKKFSGSVGKNSEKFVIDFTNCINLKHNLNFQHLKYWKNINVLYSIVHISPLYHRCCGRRLDMASPTAGGEVMRKGLRSDEEMSVVLVVGWTWPALLMEVVEMRFLERLDMASPLDACW